MDRKWVRSGALRKWHLFRTFTRLIGGVAVMCDRRFVDPEEFTGVSRANRPIDPPVDSQCKTCRKLMGL